MNREQAASERAAPTSSFARLRRDKADSGINSNWGARPSRLPFGTSRCEHSPNAFGGTPTAARETRALPEIAPRRVHHRRHVCGDDERQLAFLAATVGAVDEFLRFIGEPGVVPTVRAMTALTARDGLAPGLCRFI